VFKAAVDMYEMLLKIKYFSSFSFWQSFARLCGNKFPVMNFFQTFFLSDETPVQKKVMYQISTGGNT